MSFKDIKIGGKLAIGFGLLIIISVILGGLAVVNMNKIGTESEVLANEYVPEVKIATDLRGAANRVMYEMRGYGYTEEEAFYKEALTEMSAIKDAIIEGEKLSENAKSLVKLKEQLKLAKNAEEHYLDLIEQTHEVNGILAKDRKLMDESAAEYMDNCNKYMESQNEAMANEIRGNGTSQERLVKINTINNIIDEVNSIRVANFKAQATRHSEGLKETVKMFGNIHAEIEEIRKHTRQDENIKQLNIIEKRALQYEEALRSFITHWDKREELASNRTETGHELISACGALANAGLSGTQRIADESVVIVRSSSRVMIIGLSFALLIGIVLAIVLTRIITVPIKKSVDLANSIAKGDLTVDLDIDQKDEVGMLAKALQLMIVNLRGITETTKKIAQGDLTVVLKQRSDKDELMIALSIMVESLRDIVANIISGAENIASASQQMSSTSQEMSQGASEQASSAEEVSSSMEEMASNIQQNTDNAQQTEKIAVKSSDGINASNKSTEISVKAMNEIAEKITIINDIAFQTNILALNAAVEAARAGEHGKGFAVVAAEVRKLAERSKLAADEIDLLSRNGVKVSEEAGKQLSEIMPEIEKTAKLVQEIAAASIEQNSGADQVNSALQQLNLVTQQNAAASEEMATSSEELSSQAEQLQEIISYFRIDNTSFKKKSEPAKHVAAKTKKPIKKAIIKKEDLAQNSGADLKMQEENIHDHEFESY